MITNRTKMSWQSSCVSSFIWSSRSASTDFPIFWIEFVSVTIIADKSFCKTFSAASTEMTPWWFAFQMTSPISNDPFAKRPLPNFPVSKTTFSLIKPIDRWKSCVVILPEHFLTASLEPHLKPSLAKISNPDFVTVPLF